MQFLVDNRSDSTKLHGGTIRFIGTYPKVFNMNCY